MKRLFYKVEINMDNPYLIAILAANPPYSNLIKNIRLENSLHDSQNESNRFFSIEKNDREHFENMLSKNNFKFEMFSLKDVNKMTNYIKKDNNNVKRNKKNKDEVEVFEYNGTDLKFIYENKKSFLERKVASEKNMLLYLRSNELGNHNVPHIHAKYDNEDICSISLVDFSILAPKNLKNHKINKLVMFLKNEINNARKAWNKSSTMLKFIKNEDGSYSELLEKNVLP